MQGGIVINSRPILVGKKVVHLTSVHSPFDSRIFQKECRSLSSAGCDVSLISPHDQNEVVDGVRMIPVVKRPSRLGRILFSARKAVTVALQEKADVYHIHDPELLFWAGSLKNTKACVIYDMHEDLPLQVKNKVWVPRIFRGGLSRTAKFFEKRFLAGIPVVMAEKSYALNRTWLKESIDVMNFPRLEWLSQLSTGNREHDRLRVGYIGAVTKERGSLRLIEAMGIAKNAGLDFDFECVGPISPQHGCEVRDLISSLGLSGINLAGYLPPKEGWARIARCNIGVALLEPIPNYIDSYPTKMFEYMGMGIPVVVSDFPLYAEIVEKFDCGLVVDPMDTSAIASSISYFIENPDKAKEMGKNGQRAALEHFNWRSEEEKLIRFYQGLLADQ